MNNTWEKAPWFSSYEKNNFGDFFYALVRTYQPEKIVELGTKAGYSAYHMARGLRENGKGTLDCYDLWETYQYNSVKKSVAESNVKEFQDIVSLDLRDVLGVKEKYDAVDILHIDISNDGKILDELIPKWLPKVRQMIVIEGGSAERDAVEWMTKYNKIPIQKWLNDFCPKNNLEFFTVEPFPSVTLIRRK